MIRLFFDGLTATVKFVDRMFTAAEQSVCLRAAPQPVDDAQPAGVAETSPGGYPFENTSELLTQAATETPARQPGPRPPAEVQARRG